MSIAVHIKELTVKKKYLLTYIDFLSLFVLLQAASVMSAAPLEWSVITCQDNVGVGRMLQALNAQSKMWFNMNIS